MCDWRVWTWERWRSSVGGEEEGGEDEAVVGMLDRYFVARTSARAKRARALRGFESRVWEMAILRHL